MPMTLAEAVQNLDAGAYPYSDANQKKIRGSANKCPRIPDYNCPIDMISVDVEAFALKWAKNVANKDTPEGFDDFKKFKTWHSNVKSLMGHASGRYAEGKRLRGQDDDWKHLHEQVEALVEPNGKGCGIQGTDLISLKVLQSIAREYSIQPKALTSDQLAMWMHDLHDVGRRNALRKGARLLDKLHIFSARIDPELLPARIGELPRVSHCRQTPVFPNSVSEAITAYLDDLRMGVKYKGLASNHSRKPLSPRTITSIKEQLAWYFTCLIELGRLDPEGQPDVSDLMVLENILAAFDAEVAGEYYWTPLGARTNRKNMGAVFRFARRYYVLAGAVALLSKLQLRTLDLRQGVVGREFRRDSEGWIVDLKTSKTGTSIKGRLAPELTRYLDAVLLMDVSEAHLWSVYARRVGTALFGNPAQGWTPYGKNWLWRNMTERLHHGPHIVRTLIYDAVAADEVLDVAVAQALCGHGNFTSRIFYEIGADHHRRKAGIQILSKIAIGLDQ